MNREDIIRMAREAEAVTGLIGRWIFEDAEHLERFADLVANAERERIIAANAPEIEKINAHFKTLEDALASERERCAQICDSVGANAVLGTANECARAIRGQ